MSDLDTFIGDLETATVAAEMTEAGSWIVEITDPTVVEDSGAPARTLYGPYESPVTALELAEHVKVKMANERAETGDNDPMSAPFQVAVLPLLPPPSI